MGQKGRPSLSYSGAGLGGRNLTVHVRGRHVDGGVRVEDERGRGVRSWGDGRRAEQRLRDAVAETKPARAQYIVRGKRREDDEHCDIC